MIETFFEELKTLIEQFVVAVLAAWDTLLDGLGV